MYLVRSSKHSGSSQLAHQPAALSQPERRHSKLLKQRFLDMKSLLIHFRAEKKETVSFAPHNCF